MSLHIDKPSKKALYHYQRYSKNRLEETLLNRTIFLSSPSAFNDPWDCKPWFDVRITTDRKVRKAYISWLGDGADVRPISIATVALCDARPAYLEMLMTQRAEEIAEMLARDYRVYCLTPSNSNLLMWSHYTADHTGVCLEFDRRKESIDCGLRKVKYSTHLPANIIMTHRIIAMDAALLTKSSVWSYEEEHRIIATEEPVLTSILPRTRNSRLDISDGALRGIIVGCQCTSAAEIVDLVQTYQPDLMVKQAVRQKHRFGLDFTILHPGV